MSLLLMFSGRCGPDFTQVRPVVRPVEAAEGQTVSGLFQHEEPRVEPRVEQRERRLFLTLKLKTNFPPL